jgi:TPR repeat protein
MATLVAAGVLGATVSAHAAAPPGVSEDLARALAYEHGEGLPKDPLVAAAIYCDAARAGSAEAAFRLGWMYANGRGVAPSGVGADQMPACQVLGRPVRSRTSSMRRQASRASGWARRLRAIEFRNVSMT